MRPGRIPREEIETAAGEHLGNFFPQAFTHLALIEAVSMLIESGQRAGLAFAKCPSEPFSGEDAHRFVSE